MGRRQADDGATIGRRIGMISPVKALQPRGAMVFLFRVLLTLLAAVLTSWSAFLLARRLVTVERPALRMATTLTLFLAMLHGGLELLTLVHAFRPFVALAFWSLVTAVLHLTCRGRAATAELRRIADSALATARVVLGSPVRAVLCAWAAVVSGARLLGGILMPPLSWDALTYHLFKPARWVHYGYQVRQLAPDQWRYKEYFPQGGEVPWGWAMLGTGTDALLPCAGFLMWAACGFAAYALARSLGGKKIPCFYAGLITAFIPAIAVEMVTGYVDMFVLATFLLAATALVELEKRVSLGRAALLGLALGLLVAAKSSGLVIAGLGSAGCAAIVLRPRHAKIGHGVCALVAALASLLVIMAPAYLRTWVETGSPFYPLEVKIGHHVLFAGNPELTFLYAKPLNPAGRKAASLPTFLRALFIPSQRPWHEYMGFGPGFLLLLPSATLALLAQLKRGRLRTSLVTIVGMTVLPILYLLSDSFAAQRAQWYIVIGRLIASWPALLAILTALLAGRLARLCLLQALAIGLALAWPLGWAGATLAALRELLPTLVLAAAAGLACGLLIVAASKRRLLVAWGVLASVATFITVLAIPWSEVRDRYRYRIYQAAASRNPAFVMHLVWDYYANAWPIWQFLDDGPAHRIAVSYGWDGIGHNGLRYPLTGSRFQNQVLYVPITKSGEIIDYREEDRVASETDEAAWLERLEEAGIDYVVLCYPPPPELQFIERNPKSFLPVVQSIDGRNRAYRFVPAHGS